MAPIALVVGLGYIGSAIIPAFSRAGYVVHATARSQAKADAWLANAARLSFHGVEKMHVVPDTTVPGALDSAMRGVSIVVHCAAIVPIPWLVTSTPADDHFEQSLRFAKATTLEPMRSAAKAPTVSRFILLSTAATTGSTGYRTEADWRPIDEERFLAERDFDSLYGASSSLAALTPQ